MGLEQKGKVTIHIPTAIEIESRLVEGDPRDTIRFEYKLEDQRPIPEGYREILAKGARVFIVEGDAPLIIHSEESLAYWYPQGK